ncbi:putative Proteasome subunit alpha type-7-B [Monocercomonoides exilis]|uniref:putative Proteasome subunit alpha type-7-B n=1 Tax=Monocercomonoides exilis TaxID=2049356 RepID=UPI003559EBE9|nr:putative Proteasome subunit alpha type-7-B [Monocercomonoides exilis]|eukprot:MONOS_3526.1-p1 / transcript=MONOS_3526.1 / gene=MONOS_3526 / organism=Monocercomonoides_exilis_PA203 / gene_product=Proteasome subunit alpha type-7-B / transcript_product=Proteasome subunit alpha type-7-B / location=Mono_scaffold00083:103978-104998(-) / protein_length=250 / sequence_SO=supercontig / SO=protein_coding / is_pseudo=false
MSKYDRALTVFSPDGHLFQAEYAMEAVKKGAASIGVRGANCVILALEKFETKKLQDSRTVKKVGALDSHIALAYSGLSADARVILNKARIECQNFRLRMDAPCPVDYIARYIAGIQQKYTQSGGARPFGISTLIAGFDPDKTPHLFVTDPTGTSTEWQATAIGRSGDVVREYLENHFQQDLSTNDSIDLAMKALLEVVDTGSKNLEICVMECGKPMRILADAEITACIERVEGEKKKEEEEKKKKLMTA